MAGLKNQLRSNANDQKATDGNKREGFSGNPKTMFVKVTGFESFEDVVDGEPKQKYQCTGYDISVTDAKEFTFTVEHEKSMTDLINGIESKQSPGTYFREPLDPNSENAVVMLKSGQSDHNGHLHAYSVKAISPTASMSIAPITLNINTRHKRATITSINSGKALKVDGNDPKGLMDSFRALMDVDDNVPINARGGVMLRFIPANGKLEDHASYNFEHPYEETIIELNSGEQEVMHLPTRTMDRYVDIVSSNRNHSNKAVAAKASECFANLQTFMGWAANPEVEGFFEVIPTAEYRLGAGIKDRLFENDVVQSDDEIAAEITTKLSPWGKMLHSQFNIYKDVTNPEHPRARQKVAIKTALILESLAARDDMKFISDLAPVFKFTKGQLPHQVSTKDYTGQFRNVASLNSQDHKYLESDGKVKTQRHEYAIAVRNGDDLSKFRRVDTKRQANAESSDAKTTEVQSSKAELPQQDSQPSNDKKAESSQAKATKTNPASPSQTNTVVTSKDTVNAAVAESNESTTTKAKSEGSQTKSTNSTIESSNSVSDANEAFAQAKDADVDHRQEAPLPNWIEDHQDDIQFDDSIFDNIDDSLFSGMGDGFEEELDPEHPGISMN